MFIPDLSFGRFVHVFVFVGVLGTSGCGRPEARYVPPSDTAQQSLDAALNAWKNGSREQTFSSQGTSITVFDSRWRAGNKLQGFQITEELAPNPHREFRVKMRLAKKAKDEETTYLVIGINPLLIYRSEDYERERNLF
jgi:hypothetical protein